jgi:hypothetical protein
MGGGSWSKSKYTSDTSSRRSRGVKDFGYDDDVRSGRASGIHDSLDPTKIKGVRESRDSIPQVLQKKLSKLMDVIVDRAEIKHPQVLVGAVGDATCDKYPLQVGEFESDNRFDEQLRNIILEGNGGAQAKESYGLAFKFAADYTSTDSFEKRGKKGYLFTMGDESYWPTLPPHELVRVFGGEQENEEEGFEHVLARAQDKWEVFHLFIKQGSYPDSTDIHESWRKLLGERFVMVEDSTLVCEIIAGLVHALESSYDIDRVVSDLDLTDAHALSVKGSLLPVMQAKASSDVAKGQLPGGHPTA